MLGKLDDRPGRSVVRVRHGEHEGLDITLKQGADTHRARFFGGEDRGVGKPDHAEFASRLAQRFNDGMRGRVVRFLDPIMSSHDHRLIDHRDGGIGSFAAGQRGLRLGQSFTHEQLVIHGWMLAER